MTDMVLSQDEKRALAAGLEAANSRIRTLLTNITKNAFEIGQTLNRVKATEAWSLSFDSFDDWVATTGVGVSTAERLQKIALAYSKEEYLALVGLGKTKLYLLASVSESDRKQLLPVAKHGDVEKLTAAVSRMKASRGGIVKPKSKATLTHDEMLVEFVDWAASLACMKGGKCELNESANSGEYCIIHAARDVKQGKRIPLKMRRRIS